MYDNNIYELYEITIKHKDNNAETFYKMYTIDELMNNREELNSKLYCSDIISYTTKKIPIEIWRNMVTEKIFSNISIEDFCKMIIRLSKEVE